ncbi:MAG: radical SAM protein [Candidatus Aminicenantes bacterium]|nr:radical SAM protein [Candidatus Aminicenantes bacterium]
MGHPLSRLELQNYEDWSLKVHQKLVPQRVPLGGSIEVTWRCPNKCVHCYNNLPMNDQNARRSELTYKEHCRILDEITEAGCLWLLYTGGEVFARKDFLDIYTYAKKKGLLISLFTNGTLITPEIADYLAQWRPFSIEITLYGQSKETHEKITGIPGSYKRCLQGVRLLLERNLPLMLKTVVLTPNKHELWEMKSFVEKELGLEFRFDAMINPRLDCSHSPLAVRLKPNEIVEMDLQDPKRVEEWKKFAEDLSGYVVPPEQKDKLYQCGGGDASFAIDPSGGLSLCNFLPGNTWDLRKGSFQKGWEDFLLEMKSKTITRFTKCVECGLVAMCGMCPANGELENGDAEEPVDFLCQVAHLRAYMLDIPVPPHGDCEYCESGKDFRKMMQSVEALRQVKYSTDCNQHLTNIYT